MTGKKKKLPEGFGGAQRKSAGSEEVRDPCVFRRWIGPGSIKVLGKNVDHMGVEMFTPEQSATLSERLWAFATEDEFDAAFKSDRDRLAERERKKNNLGAYNAKRAAKKAEEKRKQEEEDAWGGDD